MGVGVYASFSFRILVDAEAMNAVETMGGNIIRHRKATIIVPRGGSGHQVFTVPAISGEAIRHGYQLKLAQLAKVRNINVCKFCEQGEFIKHGIEDLIEENLHKTLSDNNISLRDKEYAIIESCAVEDIAGFLVPMKNVQIKRTSKVEVSYMIPAIEDLKYGLDTQFHVRHAPPRRSRLMASSRAGGSTTVNILH